MSRNRGFSVGAITGAVLIGVDYHFTGKVWFGVAGVILGVLLYDFVIAPIIESPDTEVEE